MTRPIASARIISSFEDQFSSKTPRQRTLARKHYLLPSLQVEFFSLNFRDVPQNEINNNCLLCKFKQKDWAHAQMQLNNLQWEYNQCR